MSERAPLHRLLSRLRALEDAIDRQDDHPLLPSGIPAPLAHRLHLAGARAPLFALQGLARVERGLDTDDAVFDALVADAKAAEDALGAVDFWWTLHLKGAAWRLPPAVGRWILGHHLFACGVAQPTLAPWAARPRGHAAVLAERLEGVDWPRPERYRARLAEFFEERLRKAHDDVLALDLTQLEDGVHELRRKLRWFSIYAGALDGAVVLDPHARAPAGWDEFLSPEVVGDRFARLPDADPELEPIVWPAPLFFALSWAIARLGAVKDRGQWTETLHQARHDLAADRRTPGEPHDWLGDDALSPVEATRAAETVRDRVVVQGRVLLRLADAVAASA